MTNRMDFKTLGASCNVSICQAVVMLSSIRDLWYIILTKKKKKIGETFQMRSIRRKVIQQNRFICSFEDV